MVFMMNKRVRAMLKKCLVSAFVCLVLFCSVFISLLLPHDLYAIKVLMKVGLKNLQTDI